MKCPRCGNEISPEEAFCGQCGTPRMPTAQSNAPYAAGISSSLSQQPSQRQMGQQKQTGFYQDATEAMSALPGTQAPVYPPGYPQQGFGNNPPTPPFQSTMNAPYTPPGQSYTYADRGRIAVPPQKQQNGTPIIIISICVVLALIAVIGLGIVYALKGHTNPNPSTSSNQGVGVSSPTAQPTAAATSAPSPTPTITDTPTPQPTLTPSPTVVPTPAPDTGFLWCNDACINNGFQVEYPQAWSVSPAQNATGLQFSNPAQMDIYAAFKAPGTSADTANNILTGDLQTNFASKPGYTVTVPTTITTISGETWATSTVTFQLNGQLERAIVDATVHQGKAYIIELEAPDNQFDSINTQFFETMLGKFQFQ